jgi:hypothetical protein
VDLPALAGASAITSSTGLSVSVWWYWEDIIGGLRFSGRNVLSIHRETEKDEVFEIRHERHVNNIARQLASRRPQKAIYGCPRVEKGQGSVQWAPLLGYLRPKLSGTGCSDACTRSSFSACILGLVGFLGLVLRSVSHLRSTRKITVNCEDSSQIHLQNLLLTRSWGWVTYRQRLCHITPASGSWLRTLNHQLKF